MPGWKKLSSRIVYDNPWMLVHEDRVINPAGKEVVYGYCESKSNAVYVVPLDEDNNTYIVRQFRYPTGKESWECVAGGTDGQPVEVAAKRELLEEAGVQATEIIELGTMDVANGISNFQGTFCIARGLTKITDQLDPTDGILEAKKLPLSEVQQKILSGEIHCSQSIAAFLMVIAYLEQQTDKVQ